MEFLKRDELKLERNESEVERGADTDKPYTKQSSERAAREQRTKTSHTANKPYSKHLQGIQETPNSHHTPKSHHTRKTQARKTQRRQRRRRKTAKEKERIKKRARSGSKSTSGAPHTAYPSQVLTLLCFTSPKVQILRCVCVCVSGTVFGVGYRCTCAHGAFALNNSGGTGKGGKEEKEGVGGGEGGFVTVFRILGQLY